MSFFFFIFMGGGSFWHRCGSLNERQKWVGLHKNENIGHDRRLNTKWRPWVLGHVGNLFSKTQEITFAFVSVRSNFSTWLTTANLHLIDWFVTCNETRSWSFLKIRTRTSRLLISSLAWGEFVQAARNVMNTMGGQAVNIYALGDHQTHPRGRVAFRCL